MEIRGSNKLIEIIKELDIEVSRPNIFQAIVAKQYDMNTRFLKVTFKDGGTRIDIPHIETARVVINAERKDGLSKGFDGVVNEDGTVTVPLHSWMLELDGTVICDISVMDTAADDNKKLTTTSFTLIVEKAAYGGDDITSDPQYDVLVELVETCTKASVAAAEALDKSNEALEKSAEADAKYYACVEATANANAVREEIEAGGYIESLKEMNQGAKFRVWVGTQAEYDALDSKPNNTFCIITDDPNAKELKNVPSFGAFATEAELEVALSAMLDEMNSSEIRRFCFLLTYIETWAWVGTLFKSSPKNAILEVSSGLGRHVSKMTKTLTNGAWTPLEWENPPMVADTEYRTTERSNGNAVYKMHFNATVPEGQDYLFISKVLEENKNYSIKDYSATWDLENSIGQNLSGKVSDATVEVAYVDATHVKFYVNAKSLLAKSTIWVTVEYTKE